jgi:hypothetical protein
MFPELGRVNFPKPPINVHSSSEAAATSTPRMSRSNLVRTKAAQIATMDLSAVAVDVRRKEGRDKRKCFKCHSGPGTQDGQYSKGSTLMTNQA